MTRRFMENFNRVTDYAYRYLRLSAVNFYVGKKTAEFLFVAPEENYDAACSDMNKILDGVQAAFPSALKIEVKIRKSHYDPQFFARDFVAFINGIPALKGAINKNNVVAEVDPNIVTLKLRPYDYSIFCGDEMRARINEYVRNNYCEDIELRMEQSDEETFTEESEEFFYEQAGGRVINAIKTGKMVGEAVSGPYGYICDNLTEQEGVALCGITSELTVIQLKPREDGKVRYPLYKFKIDDTTGSILVKYFATEKNAEAIKELKDGMCVAVYGNIEQNEFRGKTSLEMTARRITKCDFPSDFKVNRLIRAVPAEYKLIFPQKYVETEQTSLFGNSARPEKSPYLMSHDICVFDFETTGLDTSVDRIVEIGAVKIVGGEIVETFSTLVDPQMHISAKATETSGLTDEMVKNAPTIEEVLPDFYKFSSGCVMVGHNIDEFDMLILRAASVKEKIYFDNPTLDTRKIATQQLPQLKRYSLGVLCEHFGIVNTEAHRALADTIATAKLFMFLTENM